MLLDLTIKYGLFNYFSIMQGFFVILFENMKSQRETASS